MIRIADSLGGLVGFQRWGGVRSRALTLLVCGLVAALVASLLGLVTAVPATAGLDPTQNPTHLFGPTGGGRAAVNQADTDPDAVIASASTESSWGGTDTSAFVFRPSDSSHGVLHPSTPGSVDPGGATDAAIDREGTHVAAAYSGDGPLAGVDIHGSACGDGGEYYNHPYSGTIWLWAGSGTSFGDGILVDRAFDNAAGNWWADLGWANPVPAGNGYDLTWHVSGDYQGWCDWDANGETVVTDRGFSSDPSVATSGGSTYVTYTSTSPGITAGSPTDHSKQVYLFSSTGTTNKRVTGALGGSGARISGDSSALTWVSPDGSGNTVVNVADRSSGATATDTPVPLGVGDRASISQDGRFVAFVSSAAIGSFSAVPDGLYVADRGPASARFSTPAFTRVSQAYTGGSLQGTPPVVRVTGAGLLRVIVSGSDSSSQSSIATYEYAIAAGSGGISDPTMPNWQPFANGSPGELSADDQGRAAVFTTLNDLAYTAEMADIPGIYSWNAGPARTGQGDPYSFAGDPTNTATGNLATSHTDIASPGRRYGMSLTRSYNSGATSGSLFGIGWTSNLDVQVAVWPDGSLSYSDPTGRVWRFQSTGSGGFVVPGGLGGSMVASGGGYLLTARDGSDQLFDSTGILTRLRDREAAVTNGASGQTVTVTHNQCGHLIEAVSSVDASTTADDQTLAFIDADADGRVDQVESYATVSSCTTPSVVSQVNYTYGPEVTGGSVTTLQSVSREHMPGESNPGTIKYTTSHGQIVDIKESMLTTDGKDRPVVHNEYDYNGRVSSQTDPHGGVTEFKYDTGYNYATQATYGAPGYTTVINHGPTGVDPDVTVFQHDGSAAVVGSTDAAGVSLSKSWTDGKPKDQTTRDGATTRTVYDSLGRLQAVVHPDPATGALPAGLNADGSNYATVAGALYEEYTYVSTTDTSDNRIAQNRTISGAVTQYQYDTGNNTAQPNRVLTACDPLSLPKAETCPSGNVVTTATEYVPSGVNAGLVSKVTDPDGYVTDYTYNANGSHPEDNRKPETVTTHPASGVSLVTRYRYLHPGDSGFPSGAPLGTALVTQVANPMDDFGGSDAEVTSSFYDIRGRLLRVDDPLTGTTVNGITHGSTTYTYYETGEQRSVTDPAGVTAETAIAYRSENGNTYTRAFDQWDNTVPAAITEVHRSKDGEGKISEEQLDAFGDKVYDVKPNGTGSTAVTTYVYGKLGRLVSVTTPPVNDPSAGSAGIKTTYRYDTEGRVTDTVTGPDGTDSAGTHTTSKAYNKAGQVTNEWGPQGTAVRSHTVYTYDTAGRMSSKLEGADADSASRLLTAYTYDAAGRQFRTIVHRNSLNTSDPTALTISDTVTETHYSLAGRQRETWQPPADSFDTSSCGAWTGYACFDWATKAANHASPDAAVRITKYEYDTAGRQTKVTDPLGNLTQTEFDAAGRVHMVTTPMGYYTQNGYDKGGHLTTVTTPSGLTSPSTLVAEKTYDPRGLVMTENDPHKAGETVPQRRYHYDNNGRLDVVADANTVFQTSYTGFVSPTAWWQDPNANLVGYNYDDRGNRTTRLSKDDAAAQIQEDWVYDTANNLIRQTLPHTGYLSSSTPGTSYTYDDNGRLASATGTDGRTLALSYWNSSTTLVSPAKTIQYQQTSLPTLTYRYYVDDRNRPTKTASWDGSAETSQVETTYNRQGQVASVHTPLRTTDTAYSYDLTGNVHGVTYPDGHVSYVLHDKNNRLTQSCAMAFGSCWPHGTYSYNNDGLVTAESLNLFGGNGNRSWTINSAHQITGFTEQITNPGPPTTYDTYQSTLAYASDNAIDGGHTDDTNFGRLAQETITLNGGTPATLNYAYDNAGQLCMASTTAKPTCASTTGVQNAYTYGTRGNRLSATVGSATTYYAYNAAAELCATSDQTNPGCTPTTGNHTVYLYDDLGRRTKETTTNGSTTGPETTRTFDQRGLPTSLVTTDPSAATITETRTYDGDGYLTGFNRSTPGENWDFDLNWDRNRPITEILDSKVSYNSGASTTWQLSDYGLERLGVAPSGTALSWYKYDAHQSPIASPSNTNAAPAADKYDPFGIPTNPVASPAQYSYRGELAIGPTVFLRARDYDPVTGTFTTRDPIDGVDSTPTVANPYHYGDNDSLNRTDPTGMRPKEKVQCAKYDQDLSPVISGSSHALDKMSRDELAIAADKYARADELRDINWLKRWWVTEETVTGARFSGFFHSKVGSSYSAIGEGLGWAGIGVSAYVAYGNVAKAIECNSDDQEQVVRDAGSEIASFIGGTFGAELGGAFCLASGVGTLLTFACGTLGAIAGSEFFKRMFNQYLDQAEVCHAFSGRSDDPALWMSLCVNISSQPAGPGM